MDQISGFVDQRSVDQRSVGQSPWIKPPWVKGPVACFLCKVSTEYMVLRYRPICIRNVGGYGKKRQK